MRKRGRIGRLLRDVKGMALVAPVMLVFNENLEAWWWNALGMAYLAACVMATKRARLR